MKKTVAVVALDLMAALFYEKQVRSLFGELVSTVAYSVRGGTVDAIARADLYVVSTDAFESSVDFREHIPIDAQTVEIGVTFENAALETLSQIPKGTRALFVNLSDKMVREAITRLSQLGINHIKFAAYYPGAAPVSGFDIAVTPAESRYVPSDVKTVIDIGQRVLDSNTVVEIALKLKCVEMLEQENVKNYFASIAANNYSFDQLFERSASLESRFGILTELLDEGIIGVNEEDKIFACNTKAADITGVNRVLALSREVSETFPDLPFAECRRLCRRIDTRLIKLRGVDVNVTVAPVVRGGAYMGAFAIIQRFNEEESKQHNLRIQLLNKGHQAKYSFTDIIGESGAILRAIDIARKMAKTNSAILITGESGTGKELFAHAIHNASSRKNYPFIAINCAAMPDNLLESELFGYEEGAFTGAKRGGKLGLFEFAHQGTMFLDEVEGMSPALQVKLLRVIQEREVMRVGGNKIISIDVRIVAATNEHLEALVAAGSFRQDLYYRLNTLPVQITALRDREGDILLLFEHFKAQLHGTFLLCDDARDAFLSHRWNGNIRELRNYVEYLSYTELPRIGCGDLPSGFFHSFGRAPAKQDGTSELDHELLLRLAKNPLEYCFVLEMLHAGLQAGLGIGREVILRSAAEKNMPLSQREVRDILLNLENMGFVKISKGRGGSKITERGISVLQSFH